MASPHGSPRLSARLAAMRVSGSDVVAVAPAETTLCAPSQPVQTFAFGIAAPSSQSPQLEEASQEPAANDIASLILQTVTLKTPLPVNHRQCY
ncbi:hypothetical protein FI667_g802, partial [Globisporangium splendens]